MFLTHLDHIPVLLCSQSPRRKFLLSQIGIDFQVKVKPDIEEIAPEGLSHRETALFLSELKLKAYTEEMEAGNLCITADTLVSLNGEIISKPINEEDAVGMIQKLSGNKHTVFSGVSIGYKTRRHSFTASSDVYFKSLDEKEIRYYVDTFKPFDKAGAYGIQEWIGYIGIERIDGSFYNVMGLPVQRLYEDLKTFYIK